VTGERVVTDGEQRESSFATYNLTDTLAGTGLADGLAGDGQFFAIFDDGHNRQLPRITKGPFRYKTYASEFVAKNKAIATRPIKQAVISPSMMMLLYPLDEEVEGYSREQFLDDCVDEAEKDIRQCLAAGAVRVSVDFTEGRLANENDSRNPWTGKNMLQEYSREDADGVAQVCFMGVINPLTPRRRDRRARTRRTAHRRPAHPPGSPGRHRRLRLLTVQSGPQAPARLA
jgi:hypothetical protein